MKELYNIFSDSKLKKEISAAKIIVDIHEKNSLVPSFLSKNGIDFSFESLDIGDYLIEDTIIERKTFNDFLSSMINKRLFSQLDNLKKYPKFFLLIENFDFDYSERIVHENAIRGILLSITLDFKIPIIFSKDSSDTANILTVYAKRAKGKKLESPIRPSKNLDSLEEQKQFILEGFPSIGPSTAKKLLKDYKSLREIFNLTDKELESISYLDEEKRNNLRRILGF